MAFGKKKNEDPAAGQEAEGDLSAAFAESEERGDEPELDVTVDALAPVDEPPEVAVEQASAPAPEATGGADALLSMFNSSESLEDDRSVILDLAGDAEIADLLEDLHTVAAALGLAAAAAPAPAPLAAAA